MIDFANFGMFTVRDANAAGLATGDLQREVARRTLVRVRRGIYCDRASWDAADGRQKHLMVVRAVASVVHPPFLVAGRSAAALFDLPFAATWPDDVTLLTPYRGGGKSERGVRRTSAGYRSAIADSAFGIPSTSQSRTVLDVARQLPFTDAVALVDFLLARADDASRATDELTRELERSRFMAGHRRLSQVVEFGTAVSGSVGESRCRAVIHLLGFEAPEVQVRFVDAEGEMFADFYWRSVNTAAEFDGKVKFTRHEFSRGDPAEVAWREKVREDRLRRQVRTVVRIIARNVDNPRELEALLVAAGIPRVRPPQVLPDRVARGSTLA